MNLDKYTRLLLLYGVFAPIMLAILVLILGQITPFYSPFTDTISQLGTHDKPFSTLMNTGLIAYGLCIGGATYGLYRMLYHIPRAKTLAILLGIYSLGIMFLGIFPDSPSSQNTSFYTDIVHNIFSTISYLALLIAMVFTTKIVQIEETLRPVASLGMAVFVLNLPLPVIIVFDLFEPIGGLLQRLFIASSLSWLVFTSLFLYKRLSKF